MKIAIVASQFNKVIPDNLIMGAKQKFTENCFRAEDISIYIVPGAFDTTRSETTGSAITTGSFSNAPVGRLGYPEEIATTVSFLTSDGAAYITGQTIHVNGGELVY